MTNFDKGVDQGYADVSQRVRDEKKQRTVHIKEGDTVTLCACDHGSADMSIRYVATVNGAGVLVLRPTGAFEDDRLAVTTQINGDHAGKEVEVRYT